MARVLAEDDVGGGELLEHAQRDVGEVADRRRADGERHAHRFPSSASNATSPAPIRPASSPSSASTIRSVSSAGWIASARAALARGLEHEVAGRGAEAAADDDDVRIEDVDPASRSRRRATGRSRRARRSRAASPSRALVDEHRRIGAGPVQLRGGTVGREPRRVRLEMPVAVAVPLARLAPGDRRPCDRARPSRGRGGRR